MNVAQSYFLSAQELSQLPRQKLGSFGYRPIALLVSHGWELGLKAFLRASGMSESQLSTRDFGHRLNKLMSEAERHALPEHFQMSEHGQAIFDQLARAGERHEARYLNLNRPRLTDFDFNPLIADGLGFYRTFVLEGGQFGRDWYSPEQQASC